MTRYIAFYDATCGLCNYFVQLFLALDTRGVIFFAPLLGVTAQEKLQPLQTHYPLVDSIIFLEEDESMNKVRISYWSQAVLRFLYAIGGLWKLIGWLAYLPKPLLYPFDVIYRFIARRRRNFCPYIVNQNKYKSRFLP